MPAFIDLTDQVFGRLTVVSRDGREGRVKWVCQCQCGTKVVVQSAHLRSGHTKSCGCFQIERVVETHSTHGFSRVGKRTKTYSIWAAMKQRCSNPNDKEWKNYGGRGIRVCERWQYFPNFLADMGEQPPNLSIERIDNDAGYCPENCTWATMAEQALNRRNTRAALNQAGRLRTETVPRIAMPPGSVTVNGE